MGLALRGQAPVGVALLAGYIAAEPLGRTKASKLSSGFELDFGRHQASETSVVNIELDSQVAQRNAIAGSFGFACRS